MKCPHCGHHKAKEVLECKDSRCPQDKIREAMMHEPIGKLLTGKDLLVAKVTDTLDQVIELFRTKEKNCLLVYEENNLVGILSNRDLLLRAAGKYKDLSKVHVGAVMTSVPEHVKADTPMAYVVNKMSMGGFRHLPVLREDGMPISILTVQDVLRYIANLLRSPAK